MSRRATKRLSVTPELMYKLKKAMKEEETYSEKINELLMYEKMVNKQCGEVSPIFYPQMVKKAADRLGITEEELFGGIICVMVSLLFRPPSDSSYKSEEEEILKKDEHIEELTVCENKRYANFVKGIVEATGLSIEEVKKGKAAINYKKWLEQL